MALPPMTNNVALNGIASNDSASNDSESNDNASNKQILKNKTSNDNNTNIYFTFYVVTPDMQYSGNSQCCVAKYIKWNFLFHFIYQTVKGHYALEAHVYITLFWKLFY